MSLSLSTLGLPQHPKPGIRLDRYAPPADFLRNTYAAHVLAQMLESCAQRVEVGSKYFRSTSLHKRAQRLHAGADSVLATLFDDFTTEEASTLNNLTGVCESVLAATITLALHKPADEAKLLRFHELAMELAELAGLKTP
jgi:hypothetical protein